MRILNYLHLRPKRKIGNQSSLEKSLNGMWYFKWYTTPDKAPTNFFANDFDRSDWTSIPVPADWQFHTDDFPLYSNIVYPYEINPPFMPKITTQWGAMLVRLRYPKTGISIKYFCTLQA
jgi:beta-galactosidase/beta-glucuronidase